MQGNPYNTIVFPTTTGSNAIVDAIQQYSDITKSDVQKYKLIKLGGFDSWAALGLGSAATFVASTKARNYFDSVKNWNMPGIVKQNVPTSLLETMKQQNVWVAAGAVGAGLLSYKFFYPRIRIGVLKKIQDFIDVCSSLRVAQEKISRTIYMQEIFPPEWNVGGDIALCKALNNLYEQAENASLLLNQLGSNEDQIVQMKNVINGVYLPTLRFNKDVFSSTCNGLVAAEIGSDVARLAHRGAKAIVLGAELNNVNKTLDIAGRIGGFLYRAARDLGSWSAANPAPAGLLGMAYYYWKNYGSWPTLQ